MSEPMISDLKELKKRIEEAAQVPESLQNIETQQAITTCLRYLEQGKLRVISPEDRDADCGSVAMSGDLKNFQIHSWVKQSILLAMKWRSVRPMNLRFDSSAEGQGRDHGFGISYCDKLDVRTDLFAAKVRAVPGSVVREGAYVAPGAIVMPGLVNIGAWVGEGTLVDAWATVGSCAQIGKNVHLSGGVGIGGVLEPVMARPVLIGDNAFIGSRSIVVEGAVIGEGAVLGANVCITSSTPIFDMTSEEGIEYRGFVPPHAVVAPGTRPKKFPGGEVQLQCAYIIGYRNAQTDLKVSLNSVLRETGLAI